MKFGHVALRVKDIDIMINFYCQALGLKEAFRIGNDDGSLRIVYVEISPSHYIELCLGGNKRPQFDDSHDLGYRHICFIVDNIAETKSHLEEKGIKLSSEILRLRDNNLVAYLFDPEGNKIELMQVTDISPHRKFESQLA